MSIWNSLIYQPLVNLLMFAYQAVGNNLGIAIIVVTIIVRMALIPLTNPGMETSQKMQELKPELDKLKKKHGSDKQALAQAQLQLYKEKGINPAGGILPMILQFIVLIGLFQAFNDVLRISQEGISHINEILYPFVQLSSNTNINTSFFYLDVTKPDTYALATPINLGFMSLSALPGFFLISSAVIQSISSQLMVRAAKAKAKKQVVQVKKETSSDEPDMAQMMQKQMMFMMPLMTILIGFQFPSGLVLYWLTFSMIMIVQQLVIRKKTKITEKN